MKYRKWDPKTKAKIVLEELQNKQPLSELCNNYQISQNQYYNWLKEFQSKSHKAFDSSKKTRKEQRVVNENNKLKRIIVEQVKFQYNLDLLFSFTIWLLMVQKQINGLVSVLSSINLEFGRYLKRLQQFLWAQSLTQFMVEEATMVRRIAKHHGVKLHFNYPVKTVLA